jgi:hypothetical protein
LAANDGPDIADGCDIAPPTRKLDAPGAGAAAVGDAAGVGVGLKPPRELAPTTGLTGGGVGAGPERPPRGPAMPAAATAGLTGGAGGVPPP